jgi:hypothetical protein
LVVYTSEHEDGGGSDTTKSDEALNGTDSEGRSARGVVAAAATTT